MNGNPVKLNPPNRSRTYYFANGGYVTLKDVTELIVQDSGTHRLKTGDGKFHIIPSGWIHIELDIDGWQV